MHMFFAWILSLFNIPLAMDFIHSSIYNGSIEQIILLFIIYLLNVGLCTLFSLVCSYLKKNLFYLFKF